MVRFIVQNRVSKPEQLRSFTGSNRGNTAVIILVKDCYADTDVLYNLAGLSGEWSYSEHQSTDQQIVFIRDVSRKQPQKSKLAKSQAPSGTEAKQKQKTSERDDEQGSDLQRGAKRRR